MCAGKEEPFRSQVVFRYDRQVSYGNRIQHIFVITHTMPLVDAPKGYDSLQEKKGKCIKVVLKP